MSRKPVGNTTTSIRILEQTKEDLRELRHNNCIHPADILKIVVSVIKEYNNGVSHEEFKVISKLSPEQRVEHILATHTFNRHDSGGGFEVKRVLCSNSGEHDPKGMTSQYYIDPGNSSNSDGGFEVEHDPSSNSGGGFEERDPNIIDPLHLDEF